MHCAPPGALLEQTYVGVLLLTFIGVSSSLHKSQQQLLANNNDDQMSSIKVKKLAQINKLIFFVD